SKPGVDLKDPGAGVENLLTIFRAFTGWEPDKTASHFGGMRYGDLKKQVAEAVVESLAPIQQRYREITAETGYVARVLADGAEKVSPIARETVRTVKKAMGLYTPA